MIIYEMKEYFLKEDETLQSKMEDFNKQGFELLTTENNEGRQKLILRRNKALKNYDTLVKISLEIEELENIYEELFIIDDKKEVLKEMPNIPEKLIKTFSLISFLVFLVLAMFNFIKEKETLFLIFISISGFSLLIYLVLVVRKKTTKKQNQKIKEKVKKEIINYLYVANKVEKN